ncbi:MAG: diguanylate cyclase [Lacrimispora sp.]
MKNFAADIVPWIIIGGLLLLFFLLTLLNRKIKQLASANRELDNVKELWRTFYDADTGYVYLKDKDLKYMFINRALANFFRRPYSEIIGRSDFSLLEKGFAQISTKSDQEALKQNRLLITVDSWNGRHFRTTKFPVPLPDGSMGVGAYIWDITEEYVLQRIQERMIKRNRLLLAVLSRKFRNTKEQLDYALKELLEMSGSKYGYIYSYDEEKKEFHFNCWRQIGPGEEGGRDLPEKYKLEETGVWGEMTIQRKPFIMNRLKGPGPLDGKGREAASRFESFMSVPVIIADKLVAAVGLANKNGDYDDTDITEMTMLMSGVWNAVQRRETSETLAYERNKYYQTLLSIGDGVMVIDHSRNIEFLNEAASRLTGWTLKEARGINYKKVFALSGEPEGMTVDDALERVFSTGEAQDLGTPMVLTSRNGETYDLENNAAPIPDDTGALAGVVLVFRDVTEKKEQREKIEYMSFHDALTGLYNRRFFEEELLRLDTKRNYPITILMGDVNSLKLTNDIFGHGAGDLLLITVAQAMQTVCRSDDIIARWGGDEFVVVLPGTGPEDAERIAGRIKAELSTRRARAIHCSISLGYDTKTEESEDIFRVLNNAEARMYTVKSLERDETLNRELNMLVDALFEKSGREKQHALRVKALCRRLGEALSLPESDVSRLMDAGYLHDIGKVIMEPELLERVFALSAVEANEIRKHPVIGYRILNSFDTTMELAESVLAHHERWDGTGYPKELKGEKIPLLARMIAVADAYDCMMNGADPQNSMKQKEVLEEIRHRKGTQFDPQIAETFVRMFEKEN